MLEVLSADVRLKDSDSDGQRIRHSFCRLDDGASGKSDQLDWKEATSQGSGQHLGETEEEWPRG